MNAVEEAAKLLQMDASELERRLADDAPPGALPASAADQVDLFAAFCRIADQSNSLVTVGRISDGKVLYISPAYEKIWGHSRDRLIAEPESFMENIHEEDLPRLLSALNRQAKGESNQVRYRIIRPDGSIRWIHTSLFGSGEREFPGDLRCGVSSDITEARQVEESLRELVAGTAALTGRRFFDRLTRGLCSALDVEFAMVMRKSPNRQQWAEPLGFHGGKSKEGLAAYSLSGTPCEQVLRSGRFYQQEEVAQRFPGDPKLLAQGIQSYLGLVLRDNFGKSLGLVAIMSQRPLPKSTRLEAILEIFASRASMELQRLDHERELKTSRRTAQSATQAKSEFLARMSHEIRTPMTAILGFTETLLEDMPESHAQEKSLRTILQNGEHLLELINDILDISRIESGHLELEEVDFSPKALAEEVHGLMAKFAESKGLRFKISAGPKLPEFMRADPGRLRQILINLVGNALKFTDEGGIEIQVKTSEESRGMLEFAVVDTGVGLKDTEQARVFEAFQQAGNAGAQSYGSTGLGLAISCQLAQQLGGSLQVESLFGRGSTFRLLLPIGEVTSLPFRANPLPRRATEMSANREKDKQLLEGCRILLAEDIPANQTLITHILTRPGAEIHAVENGRLAVEEALRAQAAGHAYDLILMDMQMPVMDGYAATRELRSLKYDGLIIALTANAMSSDRNRCIEAGCDEFATKPIRRGLLLEQIVTALDQRLVSTPDLPE